MAENRKYIGVDFDETLRKPDGSPISLMVYRVNTWVESGMEVRIVTARVSTTDHKPGWIEQNGGPDQEKFIQDWCEKYMGKRFRVQSGKTSGMIELWDDKVVRVEANTGRRLSPSRLEGK